GDAGGALRDRGGRSQRESLSAPADGLQQRSKYDICRCAKSFSAVEGSYCEAAGGRVGRGRFCASGADHRGSGSATCHPDRSQDFAEGARHSRFAGEMGSRRRAGVRGWGETVSLFYAFQMAAKEVTDAFDNSDAAIQEARNIINEMDPQRMKYQVRLTDYNNDPGITFADIQK